MRIGQSDAASCMRCAVSCWGVSLGSGDADDGCSSGEVISRMLRRPALAVTPRSAAGPAGDARQREDALGAPQAQLPGTEDGAHEVRAGVNSVFAIQFQFQFR